MRAVVKKIVERILIEDKNLIKDLANEVYAQKLRAHETK